MTVPSMWKKWSLSRRIDHLGNLMYYDSTAGTAHSMTSIKTAESYFGLIHKTVLTCTAATITIVDESAVAQHGGLYVTTHASEPMYTFPAGLICNLGIIIDGSITLGTTGTIINTWAGGIAVGTDAAGSGSTLTGTEATWMKEVDVAAATAKVATVDSLVVAAALTESGAVWVDGTTTAAKMFLNLVVDDDGTHTAGTGSFTGVITFHWINLGDK